MAGEGSPDSDETGKIDEEGPPGRPSSGGTRAVAAAVAHSGCPGAGLASQRQLTTVEKEVIKDEVEAEPRKVVLRVEVASKGLARILTWSSNLLNAAFVAMAIVLLTSQGLITTLGGARRLYVVSVAVGSVCLAVVGVVLAWMAAAVRSSIREGRAWWAATARMRRAPLACWLASQPARVSLQCLPGTPHYLTNYPPTPPSARTNHLPCRDQQHAARRCRSSNQRYFATTAAVLLGGSGALLCMFLAGMAATLAQPDCSYPWVAIAVLEFLRRTVFSGILFFLLARLDDMQLWRGRAALDANPDHLLLADRPFRLRARARLHIVAICLALLACYAATLAGRIRQYNSGARAAFAGCSTPLAQLDCPVPSLQAAPSGALFGAMCAYNVWYWFSARRAVRDHKQLPFCRYRDTHIFVSVQVRILVPVQLGVLLSILLLELVPAVEGHCMAVVHSQLGNLPLQLSLTVAAAVLGILYMPKAKELDSPLLRELLQDFSWTQAAVPAALERRNQRLLASEAGHGAQPQSALDQVEQAIDYLPGKVRQAMGKMGQVQDMSSAQEQLGKEPIFCMETAIRLYYWSRLAYRTAPALDDKYVSAAAALRLFGLHRWERVHDKNTDTHCVIGWSSTCVVLTFRGTSSMENTMTDLKSWRVRYTPEPTWRGRSVGTHAGFLKAWTHAGFNDRVLARLKAVEREQPAGAPPLRIWVTGHSLGGALAVLASQQISRAHPRSRQTVYTFGCPRVGNSTFAAMYNDVIPDAWAIINRGDPVCVLPKFGFKRIGLRVNIDADGNLIVRGGYFELSVVHRGTVVKNHMMGQYGLALAAIIKAQFSASKSLPGGAEGAEDLIWAVDVGAALVMSNVGLEALRDPALAPELTEKRDALLAAAASRVGSVSAAAAALNVAGQLVGTRQRGSHASCCGMGLAGAADSSELGRAGGVEECSGAGLQQQQEQQQGQQQSRPEQQSLL